MANKPNKQHVFFVYLDIVYHKHAFTKQERNFAVLATTKQEARRMVCDSDKEAKAYGKNWGIVKATEDSMHLDYAYRLLLDGAFAKTLDDVVDLEK